MKDEYVFLDELNTNSKAYKVKVKVIEKGRARKSPKKGIMFQHLLLEDDKENRMRGTLFGYQIEGYKEVFAHKGEYEIANAPIRPVYKQWKKPEADLDFQMSFGRQTVIQPVNAEAGHVLPDYQCIASVPRVGDPNDIYDVLGVIMYVEEEPRTITTSQERESLVREIVIADHSTEQPLIISAWNDLAEADCDSLSSWAEKFTVVGFTSLKANSHKGCSNCGKRTDVPIGRAYICTTCSKKDFVSCPRITFNCDVSNGTGTLAVTTFTEDFEKLFRMSAPDLFKIKVDANEEAFKAVQDLFRTKHVLIEIGPTTTLSKNNVLQWCLKQVVMEDDGEE